jgi:hypothetical protein
VRLVGVRTPDVLVYRSAQTRHCSIAEVSVMPLHNSVMAIRHTAA